MALRGGHSGHRLLGRSARRGKKAGRGLILERLEERVVLSTWTGADALATGNDNWSDNSNWDTPPTTGSDLIFPTGLSGAALTSNDDISDGSFGSLTIEDQNYVITASSGVVAGLTGTLEASQASGSSSISVPIDFTSNPGVIQVDNAGAALTVGGVVNGSAGVTTKGSGTTILTADNTYTGGTTVAAGTLQNDGTIGATTVDSGATLSGVGTVGSITTTPDASGSPTISPGDPSTTGILTDSGVLTLDSTSSFDVTIAGTTVGTNYDQLAAGGAVNLAGATLNVSLGSFTPTVGNTFDILHNTSGSAITGTFSGLANGSTFTVGSTTFEINYNGGSTGDDVVLTAVSPPVVVWSGADSTSTTPGNWSDGANWVGGVAPTAGDTIVFPSGLTGAALTSNDDITGGSYNSVLIQGTGYEITASAGVDIALTGTIDASQSSDTSTFNIPVDFGTTPAIVTVDNTAAGLSMGGVVSGSGGLTKDGSGLLDLTAANTFTGGATVADGALLVDGSVGDVTVDSGGTLGGKGTVGSITTSPTGSTGPVVSPGDSSSVTAVLTDTGALTMDSTSSFDVTINGTTSGSDYDQLAAGGTINLAGATLNISTGSFNPVAGDQFTIIQNNSGSAITGTFNGLAEGATVVADGHDFTISYVGGSNGQDVVLTAIVSPTFTWSGTDADSTTPNDNWSDPNNWEGDAAPGPGATLVFPTGPTGDALTSNNDIANTTFNSITIENEGYTITGDGIGLGGTIDSSQSTGLSEISLPITFNPGAGTITVDNSGATLELTGVTSASSGITKEGEGTLSLEADSSALGAVVDAGTLLVDGTAGDVSVNSGSTLGGSGTVAQITTVGGTLSPGDSSTVTGTLTSTGTVVLNSSSSFDVTLNGSGDQPGSEYDQLAADGTINLNSATLSVTTGSSFPTTGGQQYIIVQNNSGSAITGTFSGLAEGATVTTSGGTFTISYEGGSNGQDVVLTSLVSTTTTLSPVTETLVSGQPVTLTATVTATSGTGTPAGTVEFENGTTVLGTSTLNSSGVATLTTTKLTAGTDSLTAVYSGNTTYATSTSAAVSVTVGMASTTTTVTSTVNPGAVGQSIALIATITPVSPATGEATGTVQFYSNGTALGTAVDVSDNVAEYTTSSLPTGTSSITAVYSGDTNYNGSTSAVYNQVISLGSTMTVISVSNPNPAAFQVDSFTAVVSPTSGLGTPTGTVTFYSAAGTDLGSATLSSGQATLSNVTLPIGQQLVYAIYSGNTNFTASTSKAASVLVGSTTDLVVNQIYQDVLGVPASYNATTWIALINGGWPPKVIARSVLESAQGRVAAIDGVYESLLHRPATSAEIKHALPEGTNTNPLYVKVFGSREFYINEGKSSTDGFLTALALDWFGSPFPAAIQARLATKIEHGVSRTTIARDVISSPSGVSAQVNTIFQDILGRSATAKDQKQFGPLVKSGDFISVYTTLFASKEFKDSLTSSE